MLDRIDRNKPHVSPFREPEMEQPPLKTKPERSPIWALLVVFCGAVLLVIGAVYGSTPTLFVAAALFGAPAIISTQSSESPLPPPFCDPPGAENLTRLFLSDKIDAETFAARMEALDGS